MLKQSAKLPFVVISKVKNTYLINLQAWLQKFLGRMLKAPVKFSASHSKLQEEKGIS